MASNTQAIKHLTTISMQNMSILKVLSSVCAEKATEMGSLRNEACVVKNKHEKVRPSYALANQCT